ncbi:MAG: choice-of-anchor D domain-containing protein [Deltaproteobacteria bacterium]|nr:choice-of-anchor D domain-containing protein [Deltaproteobacteria bacterium]
MRGLDSTPLRIAGGGALVLLAGAAGCASCEEGNAIGRLTPLIEVEPTALAFGQVPLGATRRLTVAVRNPGTAALEIAAIDATMPFRAAITETSLRPGGSAQIEVVYGATAEGQAAGQLLIHSNADEQPVVTVSLSGEGVAGYVEVDPKSIDLRNTTVGGSRGAEIVAINRGLAPISGRIVPLGFLRIEHFALTGLASFEAGPYGVAARGEARFALDYRPREIGDDNGRILFETCGDGCGVEVEVLASGVSAAIRIEPPELDFGEVGLGDVRSGAVTIHNDGAVAVEVRTLRVAGSADATAMTARPLPAMLDARSSLAISVDYRPTAATELNAQLIIETGDPGLPRAVISLQGHGIGPRFEIQPEQISFGVQTQVATHRRAFLMLNAGSSEVRVERIELSGDSVFALASVPGLPVRMRSGESIAPYVTFTPPGAVAQYNAVLSITTDDPARSTVTVPVSGGFADRTCELDIAPGRVNFGLLPVGYSRRKTVTLSNMGGDPCHLVSGDFRAPADPTITPIGATFPLDLSPGQSTQLTFEYRPTQMVESKSTYQLTTDDPVAPERLLSLVGSAKGYDDLLVIPSSVDFGAIPPGCSIRDRRITVLNAGVLSAQIDAVTLTSTTTDISFVSQPQPPVDLASGGSWTTGLTYTPRNVGVDRAELEIHFADRPYSFIVPARGEGTAIRELTDVFTQVANRSVDVLFVVDDSCSMEEEQDELSRNFTSFISSANVRQVDFRIGVTTTTVDFAAGVLQGAVMDPQTSGLEGVFRSQVAVGTGGSGVEQGLEAMLGAIQRSAMGLPMNRDLFRPFVPWVIIIVSDEDDSSPAPTTLYMSELVTRAGAGFLTAMVTGGVSGCRIGSQVEAFAAPRYANFRQLTGGIGLSICSQNWSQTLAQLGSAAFGLQLHFILSEPAETTQPIEVRVDGVLQPSSAWSYDAASGAINFLPASAPAENSVVEVKYTPAC